MSPGVLVADTAILWANGSGDYATIQDAVSAVPDGSTIYLMSGTFDGPGNRGVAWSGKNVSIMVFGAQGSAVIDCEGEDRAFYIGAGVDSTSVIRGLTVRNGHAPNGSGGAIDCEAAGPSIKDCTFSANSATYGGAVRSRGVPAPRIQGCVFTGNSAHYGGAIDVRSPEILIGRSTFGDNTANSGGAIALTGCSATLRRLTICRNSATSGAALWMESSSALIEQCVVAFNRTDEAIVGEESSETCYSVLFGNYDGGVVDGTVHDTEFTDPQLCDIESGDYHLCDDSFCLPGFNPWGRHIGHLALGCGPCSSPVTTISWGSIKARYR